MMEVKGFISEGYILLQVIKASRVAAVLGAAAMK